MEDHQREEAKEKIKNLLKDRHNLWFGGILILAIIVRLYYFTLTTGQPLWWDEADYLAYAKNLAGYPIEWIISAKHNSLYPFLAGAIFMVGLGEGSVKFILQLLPSVLSVILVYVICNEMYKDKKIGLIASFLMVVLWEHLFNTTRFHIDILALFFGLLAIYVFWRGYENKKKIFWKIDPRWAVPLASLLVILTYSVRRGYFLFGLFLLIYAVLTKNWKDLVKNRYNWVAFAIALSLFLLAERFIFISKIASVGGAYFHEELPINFFPLKVFSTYFSFGTILSSLLLYLFWMGILILTSHVVISVGHIKKNSSGSVRADLFSLLTLLVTLVFFIVVLRSPDGFGEPRWYFPLIFGSFVCIARGSLILIDYIRKYNKIISVIILLAIFLSAGYYQIRAADNVIKAKVDTYKFTREAAIFLKEVSSKGDLVITLGQPQIEYYSERKTLNSKTFAEIEVSDPSHFQRTLDKIRENPNVKYILISFSEPAHPEWMKKVYYSDGGGIAAWQIPFMDTTVDFINQKQDIKQSKTYEDLTFTLIDLKGDVFIYKIERT